MYNYRIEENGFAHIEWELQGVTTEMLDWHWSNLDKTYSLWHPIDHAAFCWAVPVTQDKFIGAVHKTLQGERAKIYTDPADSPMGLEYYDVSLVPPELAKYVIYDHAVFVAPVKSENIGKPQEVNNALSFRIHQWTMSEKGVVGISSAITPCPRDMAEERARTEAWLPHAQGEIGYWEDFLPDLFRLWTAVKNPKLNPFHSLRVRKTEDGRLEYVDCK